jgi:hypothetical protein
VVQELVPPVKVDVMDLVLLLEGSLTAPSVDGSGGSVVVNAPALLNYSKRLAAAITSFSSTGGNLIFNAPLQVRTSNQIKGCTLPPLFGPEGGSDFQGYPLPSSRPGSSSTGANMLLVILTEFLWMTPKSCNTAKSETSNLPLMWYLPSIWGS